MNKLKLIGILVLIVNLSVLAQSDEWNKLEKSEYSVQYPVDWELNESGQMGTSFILFSPLTSDKDSFRENVNLLIQDLSGHNLDLDAYVEISEGQIKTMITDAKIITSERVKNGNNSYHKIIYTGKQGELHLQFEQYYWVVDNQAFVLTLTCAENQFRSFQAEGEKILNSFQLN